MVEEYFYLVNRVLSVCPDSLLSSPLMANVLACGCIGLQVDHDKAHKAITSCFFTLAAAATPRSRT